MPLALTTPKSEDGRNEEAGREDQPEQDMQRQADGRRDQEDDQQRLDAAAATQFVGIGGAVEPAIEKGYEPANPGHRMADGVKQPVRIAKGTFNGE